MPTVSQVLDDAMALSPAEREELAARLLDSVEQPPGISIDDHVEIEQRAAEARAGVPGVPWADVKRALKR
ncbi:MAG: addiction module protein [Kofleriaceae bacterium]